jgi:hypothetical protein
MKLNVEQQVLVAIYTEYQKNIPNMSNITAENLGLSKKEFFIALDKLDNERKVNNIHILRGGGSRVPASVVVQNAKISNSGIEYVEAKLGIETTLPAKEKVQMVKNILGGIGLTALEDFIAKVIAETAVKSIGK